jgi:putative ABC transport system permease protein
MWQNYWKISWQSLRKKPFYTFINLIGLATGMAISLLILLYLEKEFSYDTQWQKPIYRLAVQYKNDNEIKRIAAAEPHIAATLPLAFKQIEALTKVLPTEGTILGYNQNSQYFNDIYFADSSFFRVFDHQVLQGSVIGAFKSPEKKDIVLTESLAKEIFGSQNPVGKLLEVRTTNAFGYDGSYLVKAVIANPTQTHFNFKALISWNDEDKFVQASWAYTYFVSKEFPDFIRKRWKEYYTAYLKRYFPQETLFLKPIIQPIESIHLDSHLNAEISANNNQHYLYIFLGIALLIVTVACINFININTVRSTQRIKEFGIRKMLGERKRDLLIQLFLETAILVTGALLLSLSLAELFFPYFQELLSTDLHFSKIMQSKFMLFWIGVFVLLMLFSGIYPIFFLVDIPVLQAIKGVVSKQTYRVSFRKTLLILQFVITIIILSSTIMVLRQLVFLKSKDLGFDNKRVLVLRLPKNEEVFEKLDTLKALFMESPDVYKIANSAEILGTNLISQFRFEVEDKGKLREVVMSRMSVSEDFTDVMGLEIVAGRKFGIGDTTENQAILVNEALVKHLNWSNPIGKNIVISRDAEGNPLSIGEVIGVVKNFHISSLHDKISPLVMVLSNRIGNLFLSIAPNQKEEVISYLQQKWEEILPQEPFNYFFLNENYQNHYVAEENLAKILGYFSLLMVLVSSLGLLGLSLFVSELRIKEIAIRKMLGADRKSLIWLLSKDFIGLILIAAVFAIPISYYLMKIWLKNFAYTASIKPTIFLGAILITLFIALIPLLLQSTLRVFINPIRVLQTD